MMMKAILNNHRQLNSLVKCTLSKIRFFHLASYSKLPSMIGKEEQIVSEILALYDRYGNNDYIGEPVSQIEHMSQAAQLAIAAKAEDEVVLAAFFHDIGHICVAKNNSNDMDGYGIVEHEKIGADFLREKGFPENIAELVGSHVEAKRYLTFKYPDYLANLSEASRNTLEHQGGVMTSEEANAFEQNPLFEQMILLRKWDEQAKETRKAIIDLEVIRKKALDVLRR